MSRNDYRPLNVRDALSYLDKVKVSLGFFAFLPLAFQERERAVLSLRATIRRCRIKALVSEL